MAGAPAGVCEVEGAEEGAGAVAEGLDARDSDGSASPPTDWEQADTRTLNAITPAMRIRPG
ncbi:hypothetical protein C6A85_85600 [Mycobacterium sp. ITM-2017-0098]|nr:hypothetical protein C6A85_85600 [Mycobacterium sp. ITM-2017-0098]